MTERIVVSCEPCGLGMDVPDNPFGQIMRDVFELEHKGHENASRCCRECKKVHPTLSEELAAHGDPGS